jgi:hypothetical protein
MVRNITIGGILLYQIPGTHQYLEWVSNVYIIDSEECRDSGALGVTG